MGRGSTSRWAGSRQHEMMASFVPVIWESSGSGIYYCCSAAPIPLGPTSGWETPILRSVVAEHQKTRPLHAMRASAGSTMRALHTCLATHLLVGSTSGMQPSTEPEETPCRASPLLCEHHPLPNRSWERQARVISRCASMSCKATSVATHARQASWAPLGHRGKEQGRQLWLFSLFQSASLDIPPHPPFPPCNLPKPLFRVASS